MNGYFISGTDTGIGKTIVSAMLLIATGGKYWKPVQSGIADGTDTQTVRELTGLGNAHFEPESYVLKQPLSPHLSARLDNTRVDTRRIVSDFEDIKARKHIKKTSYIIDNSSINHNILIIEGAGGLLVPLNENDLVIDLITQFCFPVVLVCRSTLGTINHTLLSLEALNIRNLPVAGVVMSGPVNIENRRAIEKYGMVRVLGEIPVLGDMVKDDLMLYGSGILESLRMLE